MKLLKQVTLFFQEGSSDKVYEVDLCEVDGGYLVNFRYGKRDTALREGTKTVYPVDRATADKTFDSLVKSKTDKGYVQQGGAPTPNIPAIPTDPSFVPGSPEDRDEQILEALRAYAAGSYKGKWKLSRVIWRAGVLKLQDASPLIVALIDKGDHLHRYACAWALARIQDPAALPILRQLAASDNFHATQHIAQHGVAMQLEGQPLVDFLTPTYEALPSGLKQAIHAQDVGVLSKSIAELLYELESKKNAFLSHLYLLSHAYPFILEALITHLGSLPLKPGNFKFFRQIFKAAELRDDAATYGMIAFRLSTTNANYSASSRWVYQGGQSMRVSEEQPKEDSRLAFSNKTRDYFNRRVIRALQRSGVEEGEYYIQVATALLLQYDDERHQTHPRRDYRYQYDRSTKRWNSVITHYDSYAKYLALNYILYANSKRYALKENGKAWNCVAPYEPGKPAPSEREEAFPALWNHAGEAIVQLLSYSKAARVQSFAIKVYKANPAFEQYLTITHIIHLLSGPFAETNELGLDAARKKYDPNNPNIKLALALICSPLPAARTLAKEWVNAKPEVYRNDAEFLTSLILKSEEALTNFLQTFTASQPIAPPVQQTITDQVLQTWISWVGTPSEAGLEGTKLDEAIKALFHTCEDWLRKMGPGNIRTLMGTGNATLQMLAAKLILHSSMETEMLVGEHLNHFLSSTDPQVLAVGIALIGRFSDEALAAHNKMIAQCALSESAEVRQAVQPVIHRLAKKDPTFGREMVIQLTPMLWKPEAVEGMHESLEQLLTNSLSDHLGAIEEKYIWKLIRTDLVSAQRLGAFLFKEKVDMNSLAPDKLVSLGSNQVLALRQCLWQYYNNNVARIKYEGKAFLKILDATWEDSRNFGFDFYRSNFTEADWTPELLISTCDSTRSDVEAFGREMVTKFFKTEHGQEYLTKFSQHPTQSIQLFATNYIDQFAAGKPEVIAELKPYFKTVLMQINRGRIARERVFHFLEQESLKSEAVAALTIELLNELSLTIAIGSRARCIEVLLHLKAKYPHLNSAIEVKAPQLYHEQAPAS